MKTKAKKPEVKIYCDITKCVACKACELACAVEHSDAKKLEKSIAEKNKPVKRVKVTVIPEPDGNRNAAGALKTVSVHCQHCKDAACVKACMSGALSKDEKTGTTLHDRDKCVGCWMCVMVCPFGAVVRNVEDHIVVKCDLCPDRDDYACVAACPTGALFAGTKEEFEKKVKKLTKRG